MVDYVNQKHEEFDILNEIIESRETSSVFYRYKSRSEIGKKIFAELYKRFAKREGRRMGFYMDDVSREIGILSQCQSLQALMLLASDFDLGFDDVNLLERGENISIRDIMDIVIEDIYESVKTEEKGVYRFDASPYETDLFTSQYSSVETITWVVPTFLLVLKYHASVHEICKWEDELVDVISYGIKYLCDAYVDGSFATSDNKMNIGWNFTKDCEEPSLYFSFAVSECYMDFYRTFKDYLQFEEAKRTHEKYPEIPIPRELKEALAAHEQDYAEQFEMPDPGFNEKGKQLTKFDEYNELARLYRRINQGVETIEKSLYGELEGKCKAVASEAWRLVQDRLADQFFCNDLNRTISDEEIRMSTTSDALFNSIYIINILINGGYDEDLSIERESALNLGDKEKAARLQREYNELLESCQLSLQRTQRTYESLKKDSQEYIVDQFLIGFNEKFLTHRDLVRELRKRRMRVFSLVPMLIHTNNVISEYLIKYPQASMRKYLSYILESRLNENNHSKWIWEYDGFFSASNYYYISALSDFYNYYNDYESTCVKISEENKDITEEIKRKHMEELTKSGVISDLNKENKRLSAEIALLKTELAEKTTPVEDAVALVIQREVQRSLPAMLCGVLNDAAKGLVPAVIDETPCTAEHKELKKAMTALMMAVISDNILDNVRGKTVAEKQKGFQTLSKDVHKDMVRCVKTYISQINDSQTKMSSLFNSED